MNKKAYLINSIEEYGKFISFCINKDICVPLKEANAALLTACKEVLRGTGKEVDDVCNSESEDR